MPENEGFVSRWSRRKQEVAKEEAHSEPDAIESTVEEIVDPEKIKADKLEALNKLTDEDMPDIETLDEHSDFSGFMSTSVSEGLRKMALKKLFMGASYNIRDGLDEYDGDYTKFEKMPKNMITSDMKHMIEVEAKKQLAKEQEEERQKLIAAGEIEEDMLEMDEFDEFADDEGIEDFDDAENSAEEYVDEYINVEGFDTTVNADAENSNTKNIISKNSNYENTNNDSMNIESTDNENINGNEDVA